MSLMAVTKEQRQVPSKSLFKTWFQLDLYSVT